MKAARLVKVNEPLSIEEIPTAKPRASEVLVRIRSAGVCHSDLHILGGGYSGPSGVFFTIEDRGMKLPLTLGHEVAGTVDSVGEDVRGFSEGEEVVVYPWVGEQSCPACTRGEENLCDTPRSLGIFQDGGYAEYILVPNYKYLVRAKGLDLDIAAILACSGITAYSALKKANVSPGERLIIIGAGGLGTQAISLAKSLTGATTIVIDVDNERLKTARELGADHTINAGSMNVVKEVKDLTDGLGCDAIIDFVNTQNTVEPALMMLRRRAKLVLVGLFGGGAQVVLPLMPLKATSIIGSYTGPYQDLVELVALAKKGVLKPLVTKRFRLEEINEVLSNLRDGKIIGRSVLHPQLS